jgi:hypothetical protein
MTTHNAPWHPTGHVHVDGQADPEEMIALLRPLVLRTARGEAVAWTSIPSVSWDDFAGLSALVLLPISTPMIAPPTELAVPAPADPSTTRPLALARHALAIAQETLLAAGDPVVTDRARLADALTLHAAKVRRVLVERPASGLSTYVAGTVVTRSAFGSNPAGLNVHGESVDVTGDPPRICRISLRGDGTRRTILIEPAPIYVPVLEADGPAFLLGADGTRIHASE